MEAYKNRNVIILEEQKKVYYLWEASGELDLLIDQYKKNDGQIFFEKTILLTRTEAIPTYYDTCPDEFIRVVQEDFRNREKYRKINLKQLLTHENKLLRDLVKKIIDESL